ncbi:MAG TPA: CoA-binding protein [Candidatus Thermoplasmatota archaeon]|jgi:hypothetical protein|nr:CoA-binding protein [Candidatus Thermoplasmatota archaeon]
MNPGPGELRALLQGARRIAVVGMSKNPEKDAHTIPAYLIAQGYDVVPVNPSAAEILGRKSHASLRDVPRPVDIVNVFRPSEDVPPIAEDAIAVGAKALWLQTGIAHAEAAAKARAAGVVVVEDACIRATHRLLLGRGT